MLVVLGAVGALMFTTSAPDIEAHGFTERTAEPEVGADAAAPPVIEESVSVEIEPERATAAVQLAEVATIAEIAAAAPVAALRIRVEDAECKPVTGATVRLRPDRFDRSYGLLEGFERTAKTNGEGAASFDVKPIGSYRANIEKAGYARGELTSLFPGDDALIALEPGVGLEIVVLDEITGRPVPGASALLDAQGPTRLAVADAEGRAEFADLQANLYSVEILAHGYDRLRLEGVQVERSARQPPPLEVRLATGVPVHGVVRSQKGATPIAGATVRLLVERTIDGDRLPILESVTTTDVAGAYRIDGIPRGVGNLLVTAKDHADERVSVRDPGEEDEIRADVEMRLSAVAFGRVRTMAGDPVAGAVIRVRRDDGPSGGALSATSDENGEFRVENVRPDREIDLLVRGPDSSLAPNEVDDLVVPATGLAAPIEVVLEPAAQLSGRVVTLDGSPAPFARVVMTEVSGDVWRALDSAPLAFTDADGGFRMVGLPARNVNVRAEWRGFRSSLQEVVLPAAGEAVCELVLDKSAGLTGVLLDGSGEAVEGARISLTAQSSRFDSTISFPKEGAGGNRDRGGRNDGNRDGGDRNRNAPSPNASGGRSNLPTIQVGNRTIDLAEWQGRGDDSRWGLVGRAASSRDRLASSRGSATSDANGRFEILGLDPAEKHVLTVRHPDFESYFRMDVRADGGHHVIELTPLIQLRGRVVDSRTFVPVDEFTVEARPIDLVPPQIRTVNDVLDLRRQRSARFQSLDGGFTLRGLSPGYWDLTVRASGYKDPVAQRLHLVRGQRPEVLVEMIPAAWIRGKVLARDGSPVRRVPVALRVQPPPGPDGKPAKPSRANMKRAETNGRGEYAFQNVEPNTYVLTIGPLNKPLTEPVAIEIDDGELKEHDFDVGPVGDLEIEVEGRGGFGVPGASVTIQGAATRVRHRARTDGVGTLVFSNLLPDDYRITVDAGGYERLSESVSVKPNGDTDETLHLSAR